MKKRIYLQEKKAETLVEKIIPPMAANEFHNSIVCLDCIDLMDGELFQEETIKRESASISSCCLCDKLVAIGLDSKRLLHYPLLIEKRKIRDKKFIEKAKEEKLIFLKSVKEALDYYADKYSVQEGGVKEIEEMEEMETEEERQEREEQEDLAISNRLRAEREKNKI